MCRLSKATPLVPTSTWSVAVIGGLTELSFDMACVIAHPRSFTRRMETATPCAAHSAWGGSHARRSQETAADVLRGDGIESPGAGAAEAADVDRILVEQAVQHAPFDTLCAPPPFKASCNCRLPRDVRADLQPTALFCRGEAMTDLTRTSIGTVGFGIDISISALLPRCCSLVRTPGPLHALQLVGRSRAWALRLPEARCLKRPVR